MKILAKTVYKKGYNLVWSTDFFEGFKPTLFTTDNDIQVILETSGGKRLADAICHNGSYGAEENLWEVMVDHPPKEWGDSVCGHLTWKQVEKYFDREIRLLKDKKKLEDSK